MAKLIVGVDLGLKSPHRAVIYDQAEGRFHGKAFAVPSTFAALQQMMQRFDPTDQVQWVMEPTGGVWRPVAAFVAARGYTVYLVRPDKSAALRKFYARHAKTNCADAKTLAKMPVVDPEGLHAFHLPFDFEQSQHEIRMELDLLEHEERQIARLESQIAQLYEKLDPQRQLQTLPGFGDVIAPVILAETIEVGRFKNVAAYRCFVSLIPRRSQTGNHDPGRPRPMRIRKSGPRLLKKYYYLAAETARRHDVECASIYHRLRERGRHHSQAVCAVANKLVSRAYAVMSRMDQGVTSCYQYRDLQGRPVGKDRAEEIVRATFGKNAAAQPPDW